MTNENSYEGAVRDAPRDVSRDVWERYVTDEGELDCDTVRDHGWTALPGFDVLIHSHQWLFEALDRRGSARVLLMEYDRSNRSLSEAYWVRPTEAGIRFLADKASLHTYVVVDEYERFAWSQVLTDNYVLVGSQSLICEVHHCCYETALGLFLDDFNGLYPDDTEYRRTMWAFCKKWEPFFADGFSCDATQIIERPFTTPFGTSRGPRPRGAIDEAITSNKDTLLFRRSFLTDQHWICAPLRPRYAQPVWGRYNWAQEAEWMATAFEQFEDGPLQAFVLDDDMAVDDVIELAATRDALLGLVDEHDDVDLVFTTKTGAPHVIYSRWDYVLIAGREAFVEHAVGRSMASAFEGFDRHSMRAIAEDNPEVSRVLSNALDIYRALQ